MIKDQMTTYFNKIDNIANFIQTSLFLGFIVALYTLQNKFPKITIFELLLGIIVMHLVVSSRVQKLKQNALLRWINNHSN